jgi:exodeoxyribonuclease VII small subunit
MEGNSVDLSFEEAFAELRQVLEDLRGDAMTLERSINLFARGNALAEHCNTLLTQAELRVSQSVPQAARDRQPSVTPLDVEDLDLGW